MPDQIPIEKLQPCLLDRLTDDEPNNSTESRNQRVISMAKYRKGVLRDLEWLFNANAYLPEGAETFNLRDYPEAWQSVINFGVRNLCGLTSPDMEKLQDDLTDMIRFFEPRILSRSLVVRADPNRNLLTLEIKGDLWAHPVPPAMHLKTTVDVETGQCLFGDSLYGSTSG